VGDEGLSAYGTGEAWRCPVPSRGGWSGGGRPSGPAEGARRARCLRRTGCGPRNGPAAGYSPALSRHEGAPPLDVCGPEQPASLREKKAPSPHARHPSNESPRLARPGSDQQGNGSPSSSIRVTRGARRGPLARGGSWRWRNRSWR